MVLILGGTTEAVQVAEQYLKNSEDFVMTVTTEYGYRLMTEQFGDRVLQVRFTEESLREFVRQKGIKKIIDCTHPYARMITTIAEKVSLSESIEYIRYERQRNAQDDYQKLIRVESLDEAAAKILALEVKRPLFTTGSKYLGFMHILKQTEVFVRVLPSEDSIRACLRAGVRPRNIIAMHGPFSLQMNLAIIHQFQIDCIVTKRSGKEGGFMEKLEAAKQSGIWMIVVEQYGEGYDV